MKPEAVMRLIRKAKVRQLLRRVSPAMAKVAATKRQREGGLTAASGLALLLAGLGSRRKLVKLLATTGGAGLGAIGAHHALARKKPKHSPAPKVS